MSIRQIFIVALNLAEPSYRSWDWDTFPSIVLRVTDSKRLIEIRYSRKHVWQKGRATGGKTQRRFAKVARFVPKLGQIWDLFW